MPEGGVQGSYAAGPSRGREGTFGCARFQARREAAVLRPAPCHRAGGRGGEGVGAEGPEPPARAWPSADLERGLRRWAEREAGVRVRTRTCLPRGRGCAAHHAPRRGPATDADKATSGGKEGLRLEHYP